MSGEEKRYHTFHELAKAVAYLEWKAASMEAQLKEIEAEADKNVFRYMQQIFKRYKNAREHKSVHDFKKRADVIVGMFIKSCTQDIKESKHEQ